MEMLAGRHGFHVAATRPMWFDSYYVSMLSEGHRSGGGPGMLRAAWQGTLSNVHAARDTSACSSVIYILRKVI